MAICQDRLRRRDFGRSWIGRVTGCWSCTCALGAPPSGTTSASWSRGQGTATYRGRVHRAPSAERRHCLRCSGLRRCSLGRSGGSRIRIGLADYVYGVLAKDGAGQTTLPFSAFLDKLKRSLGILGPFDRPLAAAVASCIRFNLNDFRSTWRPCGVRTLDRAFWIFRQRSLEKRSIVRHGRRPGQDRTFPFVRWTR